MLYIWTSCQCMKVLHWFSKALARLENPMGFEFFLRHFAYVRTSYSICSRAEPQNSWQCLIWMWILYRWTQLFFFKEMLELRLVLPRWQKLLFPNIHSSSWFSSRRGRAWQCQAAGIWWVSASWIGTVLAAVSKLSTQNEGMWLRVHSRHPSNNRIVLDTSRKRLI